MLDERDKIKVNVKADFSGVLAISPSLYGEYVAKLASHYGMTSDDATALIREALEELPPLNGDF